MRVTAPPASVHAAPRDPRLAPVERAITDGDLDVLSLDAFDTLLLRDVPRPIDVFVLLGHRLVDAGLVAPFVTPRLFAAAREGAEQRARARVRARGDFPEVTLDDIYAELPELMLAAPRERLRDAELAVETASTVADPDVARVARAARAAGLRVVVVSDTYLSGGQVNALLAAAGLGDLDATVFTSSDHRTGKSDALFEVVTRELAVEPARVLHVGDNVGADVDAATAHGLQALHLPFRTEAFDEVLRREGVLDAPLSSGEGSPTDPSPDATLLRPSLPDSQSLLDPEAGDFGVTAARARLVGAGVPPEIADHARAHWMTGASVLGPVFTGFSTWIVERATARGAHRVACLMREGKLLAPLVSSAAESQGSALDAMPLWLSRQVCARAALEHCDYSELRIFVERRVPPTVRELCHVLGIGVGELGDLGAHVDTRLDDPSLRESVVGTISGDDAIREHLLADAAELRTRLVRMIDETRHPDDDGIVLVDLGWHATTQRFLVRALELAGHELPVAGLYLLTTDRLADAVFERVDAEGFLGQAGEPRAATDAITRSPEMLEQLCMGTEGTVLDLDPEGRPVLGRTSMSARQLDEAAATRAGIVAFGQRYRSSRPAGASSLATAAPMLRAVLARFVGDPTVGEANAFGGWTHDDNFGTGTGDLLVRSEMLHNGLYADRPHLREVDAYWPAAIVARDSGVRDSGVQEVPGSDDGTASMPGAEAGSTATIGLYADTGSGFDEVHAVHRPVPVNARGLSYVQLGITADGVRALRLDPASLPALVRIDRIALRLSVRDRPDPVVLTFTTPDELGEWELRDCEWLTGGLLVARSSDPQMLLGLEAKVSGHVYAVLASVAFTTMELPESAFGDDGTVVLGSDAAPAELPRAMRELRALVGEVRAAASRQLGNNRRGRRGYGP